MKICHTWKLAACLGYGIAPGHSASPRGPCWTIRTIQAIGSMLMTDQHQNIKSSGVRGTKRLPQTQPRRVILLLDSAASTSPSAGPSQGPLQDVPYCKSFSTKRLTCSWAQIWPWRPTPLSAAFARFGRKAFLASPCPLLSRGYSWIFATFTQV